MHVLSGLLPMVVCIVLRYSGHLAVKSRVVPEAGENDPWQVLSVIHARVNT